KRSELRSLRGGSEGRLHRHGARILGCLGCRADGYASGRSLTETEPAIQTRKRTRRPPVPSPEEAHRRGDDERAHERRVDGDGERHTEADRLDEEDLGEAEGGEDADHDRGRAGDQPATALEALGDRGGVVASPRVLLLQA